MSGHKTMLLPKFFNWVSSNQIKSNRIKSNRIKSSRVTSKQTESNQNKLAFLNSSIEYHRIKSNQVESNQIESNQTESNRIKSNQIKSKQIVTGAWDNSIWFDSVWFTVIRFDSIPLPRRDRSDAKVRKSTVCSLNKMFLSFQLNIDLKFQTMRILVQSQRLQLRMCFACGTHARSWASHGLGQAVQGRSA